MLISFLFSASSKQKHTTRLMDEVRKRASTTLFFAILDIHLVIVQLVEFDSAGSRKVRTKSQPILAT